MDTQIIAIQNVHGYVDEQGTVWLNAKDVAIGLGFVEVKYRGATSCANTEDTLPFSIRWRTIRKYLEEFGFRQEVGEGSFIPENMFYRLAMKARNETAERFQAKVADEILPQLRKTGMYKIGDKVPQTFLEALKLAVQKEEERLALEQKYIEAEERAKENQQVKHLYDTTVAKGKWYTAKNVADVMNIIGVGRTKLYDFLREIGLVTSKNEPIHKYIEMGLIRVDYYAEWLEQFVCVFSVKGIRYIFTKLVNAGKMPRDVTMDEWVKLCEDMKE